MIHDTQNQYDESFQVQTYSSKQIAIFEAVAKLMNQGYKPHNLKMAQIAAAAGIGKGTAYEYFSSKKELMQATIQYHLLNECRQLTELLSSSEDFQTVFYKLLDFSFEMVQSRIPNVWALIGSLDQDELDSADKPTGQFCGQVILYLRDLMETFMRKGIDEQIISNQTSQAFRLFVITGTVSSYVQIRSHQLMLRLSPQTEAVEHHDKGNIDKDHAWMMLSRSLG